MKGGGGGLSSFSPPQVFVINTPAWSQMWNNEETTLEYFLVELNHSKYFSDISQHLKKELL